MYRMWDWLTQYSRIIFYILPLAVLLVGCASRRDDIRPFTDNVHAHPDDTLKANDWMRYRNSTVSKLISPTVCSPNSRKTAFFVTLSGGGSRAAYFAARVLHELDKVGVEPMTPYIDAIFGVSGGSITAALFSMSADPGRNQSSSMERVQWSEEMTTERLTRPLGSAMAIQLLNPRTLGTYLFSDLTRTSLLQKTIENEVFQNAGESLTYRDLNPQRPPVFIVSAIATSEDSLAFDPQPFGSMFLFSMPDLAKFGIDLSSIPVAKAVTASAAFPGLLSPVPLPRYRRGTFEAQADASRYVHLIDGGNADNLGLLGVKRALLENNHRLLTECDNIVVLSVDAFGNQGAHRNDRPHENSPVGWFFDHKSALASFDALLAANRARLLGEFKSRILMPPGSEELCRKDGLPDDVCGGGVRADWSEINRLLKQKLLFIHVNFQSPELADQTRVTFCKGSYPSSDPQCDRGPVDGHRLWCEKMNLRQRLASIPTTFGLSREAAADLRTFVSLLNHPHNACFKQLNDVVVLGQKHTPSFYRRASASCDETPTLPADQVPVITCQARGRIFGDVIPRVDGAIVSTPTAECSHYVDATHANRIDFLSEAKRQLVAQPRFLEGQCNISEDN